MDTNSYHSPNFDFLKSVNPLLVELGARAELYALEDPNTAMLKIRQLGELLAQTVAARFGIQTDTQRDQRSLIDDLYRRRALPPEIKNLFHEIRMEGNQANHEMQGEQGKAITMLRFVRKISVWYFRTHHNSNIKIGPFSPPIATPDTDSDSKAEIERLKTLYEQETAANKKLQEQAADEAELRELAEKERESAYQELEAAMELAAESEAVATKALEQYKSSMSEQAAATKLDDTQTESLVTLGFNVAKEEINEADTRELIDRQLRSAGWTVDSKELRHSQGTRPQKNRNLAIAEWPTKNGPADYVLFLGLMPIAVVEAKKLNLDVAGSISQARRYSNGYTLKSEEVSPEGPWDQAEDQCFIPFLYSTNGRGYLKQLRTKSGIWFLDARRTTNLSAPLDGWHSPEDLQHLLEADVVAAERRLKNEPPNYLPLRDYQLAAVKAVETAITNGQREMLVAMATGTGKTRTCIALCYRLIKAKRFRRILFLVDRTSLGEQTAESLEDLKIDNNQTFADIYDVKELGDIKPDSDTRFQIATIQGMVKRLLFENHGSAQPTVGQYDCIVVDECHRGYNLDQELSENELNFRDEADYISKYSRVLEYFDAVKIGLTATPAIHTNELFGGESNLPVYQYSYRQAVLDGYLVDHEPPLQLKTKLAKDGIRYEVNEEVAIYNPQTQQQELFNTPDEINFDIESYNRRVINENFNRVICEELARHIDPSLPGKTLVYCVTDLHADMVVDELKTAFKNQYGEIENSAVEKITGKADKPLELIRRYKNEKMPAVAVTVDLLTTGIDVPAITNLVFLRRVKSRILYDQMIGRGTRLCQELYGPGEDKACFYIYDCVDMYAELQNYTDMKPVVNRPDITYQQLIDELASTENEEDRQVILDQLVAKLQRTKRRLKGKRETEFEERSGTQAESLVQQIKNSTPQAVLDWFADKTALIEFLDRKATGGGQKIVLSDHEDEILDVTRGYGKNNQRPKDYLEEFRTYVAENKDKVAAINLCATKPKALTRESLRELRLQLANEGFDETRLRAAWRETTNADIAASIIGYIRHAILDTSVVPFEDRVKRAMDKILTSRPWTAPQRKWLERIGKQFRENTLVDQDALDQGQFKEEGGGFTRLNKVFDGELVNVLEQITENIWEAVA